MKPKAETQKKLHDAALSAPKQSGVYLWKDETGGILYVGKAKSLKSRLLSYFSSTKDVKTGILIARAHTLDYITTSNEYEALLLENTLIKQHTPRYNISLKDGKTYPVIKVTNEPFPRIFRTRRIQKDGAKYYGPFPNVTAVDSFLDFVKKHYKFRQCRVLHTRKQPCLYYHIGMCSAPCSGKVTEAEYRREIREVLRILEGTSEAAVKRLEKSMKEAALKQQFELAARLRDGIAAIGDLRGQNAVVDMDPEARDYIAWASKGIMVTFSVLRMRSGRLVGRDLYRVRSLKDEEEILTEFLIAFYTNPDDVPPRIFVPTEKGLALTRKWFVDVLGCTTHIETVLTILNEPAESVASPSPKYAEVHTEKRHTTAMAMAYFNAKEDAARRLRERGDFPALEELRSLLNLSQIPALIEGIDIAHIGGHLPVASLVSFHNGTPNRKNYRIYRLKTTEGIIDDFASMREITSRRYTRIINEQGEIPDLLVIDGGIGQVNAVQGVLNALDLEIPILGLAERNEEIYLPGKSKPLKLPRRSDALRLLQRIRDESHRFATSRNQKLRTKENTRLLFEDLPGVGPKKAALLLKTYGSPEKMISETSVPNGAAKTAALLGLSLARAEVVLNALPSIAEGQEKRKAIRSGYQNTHKKSITNLALQTGSTKREDT